MFIQFEIIFLHPATRICRATVQRFSKSLVYELAAQIWVSVLKYLTASINVGCIFFILIATRSKKTNTEEEIKTAIVSIQDLTALQVLITELIHSLDCHK